MAVADVLERLSHVHRFQIIQTGPMALAVRLETEAGFDRTDVWREVQKQLADFLAVQGLSGVAIAKSPEPPAIDPHTGKFRHVIRAAHQTDA